MLFETAQLLEFYGANASQMTSESKKITPAVKMI